MISKIAHKDILAAMPTAREAYTTRAQDRVDAHVEQHGKITFCEVREIASTESSVPAVVEALVRIIESEHIITLELA